MTSTAPARFKPTPRIDEKIATLLSQLGAVGGDFLTMDADRLRLEIEAVYLFLLRVEDEKQADREYQAIRRAYLRAVDERREHGTAIPRPLFAAFLDARWGYSEQELGARRRHRLASLLLERLNQTEDER